MLLEENLLHYRQSFSVSSDRTKFGNGAAYIQANNEKVPLLKDRNIVHISFSHMYPHILAIAYTKPMPDSAKGNGKSKGEGKSNVDQSQVKRCDSIVFR